MKDVWAIGNRGKLAKLWNVREVARFYCGYYSLGEAGVEEIISRLERGQVLHTRGVRWCIHKDKLKKEKNNR